VTPDKLSIVVFSGGFERVHYALAMAAAAAATDRPTTLFFTMGACHALARPLADGTPGWSSLPDATTCDAGYAARGVATFEELFEACVELGVTIMVCEMGLRAKDLTTNDLRQDFEHIQGGIVTFLNDASSDGAMLFI
jgi:peroxiredoxin family protein